MSINLKVKKRTHIARKELVNETVRGMYEEKARGNNKDLKRLLG